VSNLIDNAFSYGKPPIVIRLLTSKDGTSLEVWDQGSGVPTAQWSRALEPFQRLDEARGQQGHCGLGLAIVNHVMQHHDGTVTVRRGTGNPGRFAVVLTLPSEGQGKG
jgi:two-component system osmolarity sensor histidine kinase EnvZ